MVVVPGTRVVEISTNRCDWYGRRREGNAITGILKAHSGFAGRSTAKGGGHVEARNGILEPFPRPKNNKLSSLVRAT